MGRGSARPGRTAVTAGCVRPKKDPGQALGSRSLEKVPKSLGDPVLGDSLEPELGGSQAGTLALWPLQVRGIMPRQASFP